MRFSPLILSVLVWKGDSYAPLSISQIQGRTPETFHRDFRTSFVLPKRNIRLFAKENKKDNENINGDVGKLVSSAVNALKGVGVSILGGDVVKDYDPSQGFNQKNTNETISVDPLDSIDEVDIAEQLRLQVEKEIAINEMKTKLNELKKAADESEGKRNIALQELESLTTQSFEMKSINEDLYIELQKEFRQVKSSLEKQVNESKNDVMKEKENSKEQVEKLQQKSEKEKAALMKEITYLRDALSSTDEQIEKAKKEMEALLIDSEMDLGLLEREIDQKDNQLEKLANEKEDLNNRLTQLGQELEKKNKENEELAKEKSTLSSKFQAVSESLAQVRKESKETMKRIKEEGESMKTKFEQERSNFQQQLNEFMMQLQGAKDEAVLAKREADETIRRQKEESKRFGENMTKITNEEKKILKKQIWDLETKLSDAEYKYYAARNEIKEFKTSISDLEKRIDDIEFSHKMEKEELKARMDADEMFYARNKFQWKKRMFGLVDKFMRRMKRRDESNKKKLETLRTDLENKFIAERNEIELDNERKLEDLRQFSDKALSKMKVEYEGLIEDLKKQMAVTEEVNKNQMDELESKFERMLRKERELFDKKRLALIAENKEELESARKQADFDYNKLRIDMSGKLRDLSDEKEMMEQLLDERNDVVQEYENDQKSFRKIAKMAWKAAASKVKP